MATRLHQDFASPSGWSDAIRLPGFSSEADEVSVFGCQVFTVPGALALFLGDAKNGSKNLKYLKGSLLETVKDFFGTLRSQVHFGNCEAGIIFFPKVEEIRLL